VRDGVLEQEETLALSRSKGWVEVRAVVWEKKPAAVVL
jgi:hypothetical protein